MILSRRIPLDVQIFLNRLYQDREAKLYSKEYRAFLIRETKKRYPGLIQGLSRLGRTRQGLHRVIADADHIVPKSLWKIVMPLAWNLPGEPPTANTLSNLFWRTVSNNRGSEEEGNAVDQPYIREFKRQALLYPAKTPAAVHWAWAKIEFFLKTKHDEGVNVDVPVQPWKLDEMREAADVSDVIEFIENLKHKRPGITPEQVAALVEEKFPYVQIEVDGRGPRIEIG